MRCYKCATEYDDSLSACPNCGAAAAVPVIPDVSAGKPSGRAASPVKEPKAVAPVISQQAVSPVIEQQPEAAEETLAASLKKAKMIIAVLSAALIIMTAAVVLLLIDRSSIKAENEPEKHRNSSVSLPDSSAYKPGHTTNGSYEESNIAAHMVFAAATQYATEREMAGDPIPYGVVFSSADIGVTSPSISNEYGTVENLTNTIRDSLGYEYGGYEWVVTFNGGVPVAVYAAPDMYSLNIGSYPTEAYSQSLISMSDGKGTVSYEYVDEYKSANDIYGS